MKRGVLIQLVLFVVIGVAATVFGVRYVAGPQSFGGAVDVSITADDAFGVGAGTSVTYRGVPVGHVESVTLAPDASPDGAGGPRALTVDVALDPGTRIPTSATARVVGASALGIRSVDIAADTDRGPYLQSGDTIDAPHDQQPQELGALLADVSALLDTVDPEAVRSLGQTIGTAFEGTGPTLRRMIDDGGRLAATLDEHAGTLSILAEDMLPAIDALAESADGFPGTVTALHKVTAQLVADEDSLLHLLDESPAQMRKVGDLLAGARADIDGLMVAGDTVSDVVGDRHAALTAGLTAIPHTLNQLTSVVHDGRADFVLVGTQGPVCYYDTPRRAVGDTAPREPNLNLYCPPGEDLEQRGSRNAPRPDDLGLQNATQPGTRTGPPIAQDPWLIPPGQDLLQQLTGGGR